MEEKDAPFCAREGGSRGRREPSPSDGDRGGERPVGAGRGRPSGKTWGQVYEEDLSSFFASAAGAGFFTGVAAFAAGAPAGLAEPAAAGFGADDAALAAAGAGVDVGVGVGVGVDAGFPPEAGAGAVALGAAAGLGAGVFAASPEVAGAGVAAGAAGFAFGFAAAAAGALEARA